MVSAGKTDKGKLKKSLFENPLFTPYKAIVHDLEFKGDSKGLVKNLVFLGERGCGAQALAKLLWERPWSESKKKTGRFIVADAQLFSPTDLISIITGKRYGCKTSDCLFLAEAQMIWQKDFPSSERKKIQKHLCVSPKFQRILFIRETFLTLDRAFQRGFLFKKLYLHLKERSYFIKPLRQRKEEIPRLVKEFMKISKGEDIKIDELALNRLQNYSWPGNLDEFIECLEESQKLSKNGCITIDDLSLPIVVSKGEENFPQRLPPALRNF